MKHIIYKATNIENGKSYIGFTKKSLWERHEGHLYDAFGQHSDFHFHRALRKYPIDVWEWNILTECDSREAAGILEIKYIAEHKTFGKEGYNSTTGGEGGFEMSEETKKKLSESRKGMVFSDEHKANLSKARKNRIITAETREKLSRAAKARSARGDNTNYKKGNIPWNKGKVGCFSKETTDQMSKTRKGRPAWNKGKPLTKEHKTNMSRARKGVPWTPARRAAHEAKENAHIDE